MKAQALFDCLADPTRRRLLALLAQEGELCVCELTAALDLDQPKISRHLGVIREAELVTARREGTWMIYRLADGLPPWAVVLIGTLTQGAVAELAADRARLARMNFRPSQHVA